MLQHRYCMRIPGGNHIDRQRQLLPRDYAADPDRFGDDLSLAFRIPDGGDEVSLRIAVLQHRLAAGWQHRGRPSGAELGRRFGCSKQTISSSARGRRWAGQTVLSAWLAALHEASSSSAAK